VTFSSPDGLRGKIRTLQRCGITEALFADGFRWPLIVQCVRLRKAVPHFDEAISFFYDVLYPQRCLVFESCSQLCGGAFAFECVTNSWHGGRFSGVVSFSTDGLRQTSIYFYYPLPLPSKTTPRKSRMKDFSQLSLPYSRKVVSNNVVCPFISPTGCFILVKCIALGTNKRHPTCIMSLAF